MLEQPPIVNEGDLLQAVLKPKENVTMLVESINEKYEYWSDVKYKKLPPEISSNEELWTYVKLSRRLKSITAWKKYGISTSITTYMQKACHEFDMDFGGSWGTSSIIPNSGKEHYLISSLMEEAISSSQIEGASTTRKVAKEMLRKKITPKGKSQQMIFNNYRTIEFITENKDKPLCEELLLKIHALMCEGTLDNIEDAGRFRSDNDVVVANGITHEVVHTPPPHEDINEFITDLCSFFNTQSDKIFIHPIIKGIIVHFMIGYMHPFVDGNGRTARALFYWYMLKNGYWLTEYLSISRVIAMSKNQYERSYLYSEADGNDIGYFITYNLRVLNKAFKELKTYLKRKLSEKRDASVFLKIGGINERQAHIVKIFADTPDEVLTVKDVEMKFGITAATAKRDISGLINRDIIYEIPLNKVKRGYIRSSKFNDIVLK